MFDQFFRLIQRGVKDLFLHPWLQVLTLAAVTLVTLLTGLFLLLVHNLDAQIKKNQGHVQFQIYWRLDTPLDQVKKQWLQLDQLPNLAEKQTFTPEQALNILSESLAPGVGYKQLQGKSPLPATALVHFILPEDNEDGWSQKMLERLNSLPGVAKVHFNPLQVDLAQSWLRVSRLVVWPLILFLGLVLALIVGNTIKLSQFHRRDEVEILRLVGASRFYIQLPMLAGGAFQGFSGSVLALGMLKGLQLGVKNVLNFPPLWLQIDFLPLSELGLLVLALTVVGLISSWVAVRS